MQRCQWLSHPNEHLNQIKDLAKIAGFYAHQLDPQHPLKSTYQTMHNDLQAVLEREPPATPLSAV